MEAWLVELLKYAGSGIAGFAIGRYQDRVTDVKDAQRRLPVSVRELCRDAIYYHSKTGPVDDRLRRSVLLKAKLMQVRTDLGLFKERCDKGQSFVVEYLAIHDAVTAYPFEPGEMPDKPDGKRLEEIARATEALVDAVCCSKPRWF